MAIHGPIVNPAGRRRYFLSLPELLLLSVPNSYFLPSNDALYSILIYEMRALRCMEWRL